MTPCPTSRRALLAGGASLAAGLLFRTPAGAAAKPTITVYKPPT